MGSASVISSICCYLTQIPLTYFLFSHFSKAPQANVANIYLYSTKVVIHNSHEHDFYSEKAFVDDIARKVTIQSLRKNIFSN
jgi:hypothetical protein